jgi:hypothetical protein
MGVRERRGSQRCWTKQERLCQLPTADCRRKGGRRGEGEWGGRREERGEGLAERFDWEFLRSVEEERVSESARSEK